MQAAQQQLHRMVAHDLAAHALRSTGPQVQQAVHRVQPFDSVHGIGFRAYFARELD